jgi:tight adherence protein C
MPVDPIFALALAGIGLSTALFAYLAATASQREELVDSRGPERGFLTESPLLKMLLGVAKAIAPLHAGVENTPKGQELDRQLRRAGRPFGMTVPVYLSLRYPAAALGGILGYGLSIAYQDSANWTFILGIALFGFFYPTLRLKQDMQKRMLRIFRDLPYTIDLLTLSTEAGQDFSSAMETVVEKGSPGPLLEEFKIANQEVTLGKSRAESLRAMAERIDLTEMTSFVLALIQAEQLGTGVGPVLRVMAEQTRVKRWQLAEEAAGKVPVKVPVKLMAPLVATIFPASFIVLFVPLVIQTWMVG